MDIDQVTMTVNAPGMEPKSVAMTGEQFFERTAQFIGASAEGEPLGLRPPEAIAFEEAEAEFLEAPELERLALEIIGRHKRFRHLAREFTVVYLWKSAGGMSNGSDTLGKCTKPSGLLKHFSETHFVIWLAADHIRARLLSPNQIEGILYHELCHADQNDKGEPVIIGHDWAGFASEIEEYGFYLADVRRISQAVQLRLKGIGTDDRAAAFGGDA